MNIVAEPISPVLNTTLPEPEGERPATPEELVRLKQIESSIEEDKKRENQINIINQIKSDIQVDAKIEAFKGLTPESVDTFKEEIVQVLQTVVFTMSGGDQMGAIRNISKLPAEIKLKLMPLLLPLMASAKVNNMSYTTYDILAEDLGYIFNTSSLNFVEFNETPVVKEIIISTAKKSMDRITSESLEKAYGQNSHLAKAMFIEVFTSLVFQEDSPVSIVDLARFSRAGDGLFENSLYQRTSAGPLDTESLMVQLENSTGTRNVFNIIFVMCAVLRINKVDGDKVKAQTYYTRMITLFPFLRQGIFEYISGIKP
ncbi:MAG: hypothetical protein ACMG57_00760 [Candidatus Dojkabacteria bacterium]